MVPIYLETWRLNMTDRTCHGCIYLSTVGVFHRGQGPEPPLHEHCTCSRRLIVSRGMSITAFAALKAEADRNGARAGSIEARARNLLSRG